MFENPQHVEEEMRTPEVHDQKNWRKDGAGDRGNPHRCAGNLDLMKQDCAERDHCRHPADATKEKVERHLPSPDRRFHHRLSVVARFAQDGSTDNVNTATWDNALLPCFLAQLFKALFGRHEKNAKPSSVAMNDAMAVANAAIQADFK